MAVSVIGPQFIAPCPVEIIVDTFSIGTLIITDINHKILFKVKPWDNTFHRQRVLLDPNDKPIVFLRDKNMSLHARWNVFRGESKSDSDLLFSAKSEHMIQLKTSVSVSLPSSKNDCDFMFKGSWEKKDCSIFMGNSSTKIAYMHKSEECKNLKYSKDKFMVTINPHVDNAFVAAIITIVDAMKNQYKNQGSSAAEGVGAAVNVVGAIASS